MKGILGCDLVGFHIEDYCINFIECCQVKLHHKTTKITFFTMNIIEQRGLGCRVDRVGMLVELGGRTIRSEKDLHKYICTYTCKHNYHYHNVGGTIRSKTGICPNKFVHVLVNTVNIVIMLGGQSHSYKKNSRDKD